MKPVKGIGQMTKREFGRSFSLSIGAFSEEAFRDHLRWRRWPIAVSCPRCGNEKVYELRRRKFHWQCHSCNPRGYRFSVLTHTPFENAKSSLKIWFPLCFFMVQRKGPVNIRAASRALGVPYRTCWRIWHRILDLLRNSEFQELLGISNAEDLLEEIKKAEAQSYSTGSDRTEF